MRRNKDHRSRRLRPAKRARAIYGEREDQGKYFRCQHCGFICNLDRDELGGSSDRSGLVYENYSVDFSNSPLTKLATLESDIEHFQTTEDIFGTRQYIRAKVVSGCPFCGSRNWRGDF
jgi:hypothetical protein